MLFVVKISGRKPRECTNDTDQIVLLAAKVITNVIKVHEIRT